jgi:hypothetical protein
VVHTIDTHELPAEVSTTITVTSTSTDVVSETETELSKMVLTQPKAEITRPTSTVFPACSADHLVDWFDGDPIAGVGRSESSNVDTFCNIGEMSEAEDCCKAYVIPSLCIAETYNQLGVPGANS